MPPILTPYKRPKYGRRDKTKVSGEIYALLLPIGRLIDAGKCDQMISDHTAPGRIFVSLWALCGCGYPAGCLRPGAWSWVIRVYQLSPISDSEMDDVGSPFGEGEESSPEGSGDPSSKRTAAQYLAAINQHAQRNKESFLSPGTNYRILSQFLARTTDDLSDRQPSLEPHYFAHTYTYKANQTIESQRTKGSDLKQQLKEKERSDSADANLVFLQGYSCPSWLVAIGAFYKVDPELWRRHLDFHNVKDYYDIPGLQSNSRNIVQLKFTTICTRKSSITRDQVLAARRKEGEDVDKHQKRLGNMSGESIIRKFSVHNETTFTLEQTVSCYIRPRKGGSSGWTAVVWLDSGRSLNEGNHVPWVEPSTSNKPQNEFHSTLQYRPMVALKPQKNDNLLRPPQSGDHGVHVRVREQIDSLRLSGSILASEYGSSLNPAAAQCDVLYALNELFTFAANSECQFLNFMAAQISQEMSTFEDHMTHSLQNLRYNKALIDDHIVYLSEVLAFLQNYRVVHSHHGTDPQDEIIQHAEDSLLRDYEDLVCRARELSARCLEGASNITSSSQLRKWEQAITESQQVNRLTLLAFFFGPLNLGTSFFGMNFREFGTGTLNIWVCIPVFSLMITISAVLLFPQFFSNLIPRRTRGRSI